jgi:branched-chain amino acid transport system permease protein
MITLAIAAAFFYLTLQNWPIFNGFAGFTTIPAPIAFGVNWKQPLPLYYLILFFAALSYMAVVYISRAPFGLALQGVRDNPRRMEAIGYNVTAHRVAAYAFAALIASIGGILMVWLNNQISPGSAGIEATIDLLVIAVVGGLGHPIGAFVGALIYVILRTFALDALVAVGLDGRRFQTLIGLGFLLIVLFSPDGVIGLWRRFIDHVSRSGNSNNGGNRSGH